MKDLIPSAFCEIQLYWFRGFGCFSEGLPGSTIKNIEEFFQSLRYHESGLHL